MTDVDKAVNKIHQWLRASGISETRLGLLSAANGGAIPKTHPQVHGVTWMRYRPCSTILSGTRPCRNREPTCRSGFAKYWDSYTMRIATPALPARMQMSRAKRQGGKEMKWRCSPPL